MSVPISACLIARAIKGKSEARLKLKKNIAYNKKFGHFSIYPCQHNPSCMQPTSDEDLNKMMTDFFNEMPEAIILFQ